MLLSFFTISNVFLILFNYGEKGLNLLKKIKICLTISKSYEILSILFLRLNLSLIS